MSAPGAEDSLEAADWVLPMPLSAERLAERGFNQSWLLAKALSPSKADAHLLLRTRNTPSQRTLPRSERLANLLGAFAVEPLRAAFARMPEYRVHIRPLPWARALAELAKGRAFALYPPYHRPSERPWMDYSRPILREKLVVFLRAEVARRLPDEQFPQAYSGLRIGQTVEHPKFGIGVIVSTEGRGGDARVQVNFGGSGMKWLALEYAKLTPC